MSSRIGFHPDARRDLREAADFYDLERLGLGAEYLDEVEQTMRRVIEYPESSPVVLGRVRKCAIPRSPYTIVYSARGGGGGGGGGGVVYVSAVAHNSRRPFYWRDRL
ncbi:MAG: type II toxin-antitoxin system RelE/ParE family toxin [Actinomycetes bacterium]